MKIALINYYLRTKDYPTKYSLAVLRLAEYVSSFGYDVDIIPISLNCNNLEKVIDEKIKNKYDIVGISHYVWSKDITKKIAEIIREQSSKIKVIIGGPEVRNINLNDYNEEIFILGEGERALLNTIQFIENRTDEKTFFEKNDNIYSKKYHTAKLLEEDISYVNPLFTKFKNIDKEFLYYETSRGCAYKCGYCGFRNREKIANFDLNFIEKEIMKIGELEFKEVFIIDANLGGTKERAKIILKNFNKYASNSKLTIYMRPEFIDDEMIEILKVSNIKEIRIGIQTINNNVPKWIRSNSLYHILNELPKLHENNIPWKAELIIGLPGDNIDGLKKSIDFVEEILKPTEYCCYPLTLIDGTPIYDLVNNFENENWIVMDENKNAFESSSYSHDDLLLMQKYAIERMNNYLEQSEILACQKIKKINRNKIMYKGTE